MTHFKFLISGAVTAPMLFLTCATSLADQSLGQSLSKIVKRSGLTEGQLSLYVTDAMKGGMESVLAVNEKQKRIPASLTKIFTAATALSTFPVGHQFVTSLRASGESLCLVGDGDPGFVSESMWNLVNEFLRTGQKVVAGDIIVDDTKFDDVPFDSSRDGDRNDRAYDSPISGMTFNWSAINVFVRPGPEKGSPAKVWLDPENDYFTLDSKVKTSGGSGSDVGISLLRINDKKAAPARETVQLSGSHGVAAGEKAIFRAVDDATLWAGYNLKSFLRQRGIEVRGGIRKAPCPSGAPIVAAVKSKSIAQLVTDMMKFSNNFVAEMLTKNLAALKAKSAGSANMQQGVKVIRDFLSEQGYPNFVVENPSGLSRKNQASAEDMTKFMMGFRGRFDIFPEYLASLPMAGVDGTLKSRMRSSKTQGAIRAKTGLLNGVAGLAGFAGDGQRLYAFTFIYNGAHDATPKARDLFDRLSMRLIEAP
jgi:serine-type D-Ala-D-Ala carboxypeptidase/endopeptidase (penicillin-binding protein 4)